MARAGPCFTRFPSDTNFLPIDTRERAPCIDNSIHHRTACAWLSCPFFRVPWHFCHFQRCTARPSTGNRLPFLSALLRWDPFSPRLIHLIHPTARSNGACGEERARTPKRGAHDDPERGAHRSKKWRVRRCARHASRQRAAAHLRAVRRPCVDAWDATWRPRG